MSWIGDKESAVFVSCSEEKSLSDFSIALSKLLFNSEDARQFVKSEALKEYDNDTDVFYPLVKNNIVGNTGKTFRELLLPYFENESDLERIEENLPLLTMFVPDATWLIEDGFNAAKWDTGSNEVVTLYRYDGRCNTVYADGQLVTGRSSNSIPACASVIVKNNERIVTDGKTKSGELNYRFVSDVFDGSKRQVETKNGHHPFAPEVSYYVEETDNSEYVDPKKLSRFSRAVTSYELFKSNPSACQRDYVLFGMTSDSSSGSLRKNVRDILYRFKLEDDVERFADDFAAPDSRLKETNYSLFFDFGTGAGGSLADYEIIQNVWADGKLEIFIQFIDKSSTIQSLCFSVYLRDCYSIKAKVEYWHTTFFKWYRDWEVTVESMTGKWIYPSDDAELPVLDLANLSSYTILINEKDSGATVTEQKSFSATHSTEINSKFTGLNKIDLGWNEKYNSTDTHTTTVSWKSEDDFLYHGQIQYDDDYILGAKTHTVRTYEKAIRSKKKLPTKAAYGTGSSTDYSETEVVDSYKLNTYYSGMFKFCILPIEKR